MGLAKPAKTAAPRTAAPPRAALATRSPNGPHSLGPDGRREDRARGDLAAIGGMEQRSEDGRSVALAPTEDPLASRCGQALIRIGHAVAAAHRIDLERAAIRPRLTGCRSITGAAILAFFVSAVLVTFAGEAGESAADVEPAASRFAACAGATGTSATSTGATARATTGGATVVRLPAGGIRPSGRAPARAARARAATGGGAGATARRLVIRRTIGRRSAASDGDRQDGRGESEAEARHGPRICRLSHGGTCHVR